MARRSSSLLAAGLGAAVLVGGAGPAHAFSPRLHMMIANKVRAALIASGGTQIPLWQGGHAVTLSADDARSIIEQPAAFRAGAIGPDNVMFPGLTDPSHAVAQRPFEQCQRLYEAAVLDRERAYAMGCFLHGATDAVAHHYVNYMTGETFTLNPITSGREQSFSNVVRHIIAEEMLDAAAAGQDPAAFTEEELAHDIPKPFLLRTYFDTESAVYALMATRAVAEYNATIDANPGDSLPEIIFKLDVGPADHLVLAPVYVDEVERTRIVLRGYIADEIESMQDWSTAEGSQLLVLEGDDGVLGTKDDSTDCSASCPSLFAKYFVYTGLLAPRYDANGNELPPAWDKVSDEFGDGLAEFGPSFVDVIDNVSHRMNGPPDQTSLADISPAQIQADFDPLVDWADRITTFDYESIVVAVSPEWLLEMDAFFQSFGINVDVVSFIQALTEPIIAPVRDAIRGFVIDQAKDFIIDLSDQYTAIFPETRAEYDQRLAQMMPPTLPPGTPLDHFYATGLYGHSYNITAAALANHAVVLPLGTGPIGAGPASFDTSHTQKWMQAGLCGYLSRVIFPLGLDVAGSMSIVTDIEHRAVPIGDAPVECHQGSLFEFTPAPSIELCGFTTLETLMSQPEGCISRGHPPELDVNPPLCAGILVPGLPGPDQGAGAGAGGAGAAPRAALRAARATG